VRVSDNMKPIVTVLIDTYNHERFIEEAIVSVLEQDFPSSEMEILVVDDGSTDRTPEIVRKFEPRVRLIRKVNGGQASAFNAGIPEAKGEFIAFLDGDDWWAKNKLSRVMQAFDQDPTLGVVGHGNVLVYPDGSQVREVLREGFRFQANTPDGARLFRLRKSFLGTSRLAIRADLVKRIIPVPEELRFQADEYLFTLASVLQPVAVLPDTIVFYRQHDSNYYQISQENSATRVRQKQTILSQVARTLSDQLKRLNLDSEVYSILVEILWAEALQMRLMVEDGWPWETVRAEWKIYEVMCPEAPVLHRIFKVGTLFPALLLPPRTFYKLRNRLVASAVYARIRQRVMPNPPASHVEIVRSAEPGARQPGVQLSPQ
jgi:glycosyltransferase involved in cell wall biosynthesis